MKNALLLFFILFATMANCQTFIVKANMNDAIAQGKVNVTNSNTDIGSIDKVFDNNNGTLARSASINPFIVTLQFKNPINLCASTIFMTASKGEWTLECADNITDLQNQRGTYLKKINARIAEGGVTDSAFFSTIKTKVIQLSARRTTGDNYVHLCDWKLYSEVTIDSLAFLNKSDSLLIGEAGNAIVTACDKSSQMSYNFPSLVIKYSSSDQTIATVNDAGRITPLKAGSFTLIASCNNITASKIFIVSKDSQTPDLTICYIKRLPEIDYVTNSTRPQIDGWPAVNQDILWRAYVKNWSGDTLKNVSFEWKLNDVIVKSGTIAKIPPYSLAISNLDYKWNFDRKELKFNIDSKKEIIEVNETNNELLIYTDAISLNLYVEKPVYDYFRKFQYKLNAGTNCWEDWAQILLLKRWNKMFAEAIHPDSPNGVIDRIRIDSIVVVPENALPLNGGLASNNPNKYDKTVDLQWGFPTSLIVGTNNFYSKTTKKEDNNPFFFEGSLLHELGHARYLIDSYGFNVHAGAGGINIGITENGTPIVGTKYLPYAAWDCVHYNDYDDGLMSGGYTKVDAFVAFCLNRIAKNRALCGNMNAPCNVGAFINDLPTENKIIIKDDKGNVLKNASVKIYQATGVNSWYGKTYDNIPDLQLYTDNSGSVLVGRCPFSKDGIIKHTYGLANSVIIIRIESGENVEYTFLESNAFNMEYWRGNTALGTYSLNVHFGFTVGINDFTTPDIITIFPNPCSETLTIGGIPENSSVTIFDINGKQVLHKQLLTNQIDVGCLLKGIYFLKIKHTTLKFVKN